MALVLPARLPAGRTVTHVHATHTARAALLLAVKGGQFFAFEERLCALCQQGQAPQGRYGVV